MADNAATSGGSAGPSALLRTVDTATDTATGVTGAGLALGGLQRVGGYNAGQGRDKGAVDLGNGLYVDARSVRLELVQLRDELIREVRALRRQLFLGQAAVATTQGRAATLSGVAFSLTSVQIVGARVGRRSVKVFNDNSSAATLGILYLRIGALPALIASGGYTIPVAVGGYYEMPAGDVELAIQGIWAAGTTSGFANVTEVE